MTEILHNIMIPKIIGRQNESKIFLMFIKKVDQYPSIVREVLKCSITIINNSLVFIRTLNWKFYEYINHR